jgi:hypothetical protein
MVEQPFVLVGGILPVVSVWCRRSRCNKSASSPCDGVPPPFDFPLPVLPQGTVVPPIPSHLLPALRSRTGLTSKQSEPCLPRVVFCEPFCVFWGQRRHHAFHWVSRIRLRASACSPTNCRSLNLPASKSITRSDFGTIWSAVGTVVVFWGAPMHALANRRPAPELLGPTTPIPCAMPGPLGFARPQRCASLVPL